MPGDVLTAAPVPADQRVHYGSEPEQFADLYFAPEKANASLVINIHGGYWRTRYDLTHAGPFCAALASRGVNVANLEYRRVGLPGGGWPGSFEDVRCAYHFLQRRAPDFGAAQPPVVVGHSAGGQLALCLAAYEESVRACVSLAGVLDLCRAWQLQLSDDAVVKYLGGTPAHVPQHYREASPMELSIRARQVIVHGLCDGEVPRSISRDYADAKRKRGEHVESVLLADADHFDLIAPGSSAFATVAGAVLRLVSDPGWRP